MRPEDWVVFGALIGAAVVVVGRAALLGMLGRLGDSMGPANWDFSKSWASSFTVVGAVLGTILSARGVVPDKTHILANPTYAALSLSFGLLVVLAPFLYISTSGPIVSASATPPSSPQYQGSVFSFLLATLVTTWGVTGELGTIFLLLDEIHLAAGISIAVISVLLIVFVGTGLFVRYIWRYLDAIDAHHQAAFKAIGVTPSPNTLNTLPQWPLLQVTLL